MIDLVINGSPLEMPPNFGPRSIIGSIDKNDVVSKSRICADLGQMDEYDSEDVNGNKTKSVWSFVRTFSFKKIRNKQQKAQMENKTCKSVYQKADDIYGSFNFAENRAFSEGSLIVVGS